MLCAMCLSIFETDPGPNVFPAHRGPHHASIADVQAAAQQGCYLCSELILDYDFDNDDATGSITGINAQSSSLSYELRLQVIISPDGRLGMLSFESADERLASGSYEIVYTENLRKPPSYDQFLQYVRIDLSNEPWRVRNDGFESSQDPVPKSTGDPAVLKIAEGWLNQCKSEHSTCEHASFSADAPWYPRRLLDLSGKTQRIIVTEEEKPTERYATLSHCWGPNPAICCLTADNMMDWQHEIPTELLTKSFSDAIAATRMLKIRYLWIDSLCIQQAGAGSKEDWQVHAVAMRLVYTNSLVNIAAARAESGADGAFTSRDDLFFRPCHVLWRWPTNFRDYNSRKFAVDPFWTIRRATRHQGNAIRLLPLYSRGWVVQERFLAPRVLHFGEDRIFWECNELQIVDESFPQGFRDGCPAYHTLMDWPFDLSYESKQALVSRNSTTPTAGKIWASWLEMINEYTRCDLSFPEKDIFIALAGVAEKFGQHFGDQYVAGLFRKHLPFDLLWQNRGERSEDYRAPSWSWASIDGQVEMPVYDCPSCDECCNRFATVKDAKVELENDNIKYGRVVGAELALTCYFLPCRIQPAATSGTGLRQRVAIYWRAAHNDVPPPGTISNKDPSIIWGEADIDDEDDSLNGFASASSFSAWALPILEYKVPKSPEYAKHWGLLIKKNEKGQYMRLGLYRVRDYIMTRIQEDTACVLQDVSLV